MNQIEGNIALFCGLGAFNQPVSKDLKKKTLCFKSLLLLPVLRFDEFTQVQ